MRVLTKKVNSPATNSLNFPPLYSTMTLNAFLADSGLLNLGSGVIPTNIYEFRLFGANAFLISIVLMT